ncbi:unnamed protein product, partial [Symbiodinium sp. CCMP2592]
VKSFDNAKVMIVKKDKCYYLKATLDVNLPRGFRIAGVGGGRMSQQKADPCIQLEMPQGDKTWVDVSHGVEDGEEGVKRGTEHRSSLYQVVKELHKSGASKELSCTGYKIGTKAAGSGGTHGFALTKSDDWYYILRDKDEKKLTPGNMARELVLKGCRLSSNVVWAWKFSFDPVHTKLTAKKPMMILDQSVRLQNGKYIKLAEESS